MDDSKRKMRQQADLAFQASLCDFQNIFDSQQERVAKPTPPKSKPPTPKKDLDLFDEVVADIDAFMQRQSDRSS